MRGARRFVTKGQPQQIPDVFVFGELEPGLYQSTYGTYGTVAG
jgi:hypothetical protein